MKLSILITVYNQIEIVRKNIEEILKYHGDDIEIVVSDDCSKDDIKGLVRDFNDTRIVYTQTAQNKGLDNNIINGLKKCSGDYILLLRARDFVIGTEIPVILSLLSKNSNIAYALFSAIDEEGNVRMLLEDKIYSQYEEARLANDFLLPHPSGQIYKRELLAIDTYEKYVNDYFPLNNGCIFHKIVRMDLANKGDFLTSSKVAWIYYNTVKRTDESVQPVAGKLNFYHPIYHSKRYEREWEFICNEIKVTERYHFLKYTMLDYGRTLTVHFLAANRDKEINKHYRSKKVWFNPYKALKDFEKQTNRLLLMTEEEERENLKKELAAGIVDLRRRIMSTQKSYIVNQIKRPLRKIKHMIFGDETSRKLKWWDNEFRTVKQNLWKEIETNESLSKEYSKEVEYLKRKGELAFIPYDFCDSYSPENIECSFDESKNMFYVMHKGNKKLYFPFKEKDNVLTSYSQLLMEQDENSPHLYFSPGFEFGEGDVFVDVGAAEGIISLDVIEKAKKVILLECDKEWERALEATFEPWKDKVVIVNKYVSNKNEGMCITLDTLLENESMSGNIFVKMDIEGMEKEAIEGSMGLIKRSAPVFFMCATYHTETMASDLKEIFESSGYTTEFSKNYTLFFYGWGCYLNDKYKRIQYPYFRKGIIRAKRRGF